jgi:hypothetical protein
MAIIAYAFRVSHALLLRKDLKVRLLFKVPSQAAVNPVYICLKVPERTKFESTLSGGNRT